MPAKVLVVEDEAALSELLIYNLTKEGFATALCEDGDDALIMVEEEAPDLILLDWMLPHQSGIEICRQLRARAATRHIPVIMLTARGDEGDRVRGLTTGADDYVSKPFSMDELIARARALMRRAAPQVADDVADFEDIRLDRAAKRVHRGRREVRLAPTEFRLLEAFLRRPGRVFSRDQLLDRVWGHDADLDLRTVDVHVGRLRRALNRGRERDPIRTVRGAGYGLDDTYRGEEARRRRGGKG